MPRPTWCSGCESYDDKSEHSLCKRCRRGTFLGDQYRKRKGFKGRVYKFELEVVTNERIQ